MIVITVEGDRGQGKTVTALRIVRDLRKLGMEVRYEGHSAAAVEELERLLEDGPDWLDIGLVPREFVVVDTCNVEAIR